MKSLKDLYSGIYGKGLCRSWTFRCQTLLLSIMFGSELQRGEIIIIADEAKGSRWRQRDSSELFNLSDHIVTCSISGRRKSFHLCRRKGEWGQLASTVRQLHDKRYITKRGSQANERQKKFSFRSDRILQSSCYINHVWGTWHAHIMACCEVRHRPRSLSHLSSCEIRFTQSRSKR